MSEKTNLNERYVIFYALPTWNCATRIIWFCATIWCNFYDLNGLTKGVKLYIKEHPSIFTFSCHWKERTVTWYKKILKLNNVKLVNLQENSYKLIDKSICVTTISGTVAGEAIIRGKKLLFLCNGPMHFIK